MQCIQDEFDEIEANNSWYQVFMRIRQQTQKHDYSLSIAKKPSNKRFNRYRDVSPYDHSRVKLERGDSDYINASLVEVPEADRKYILAQGPLEHTIGHFWQMVWEQKSKAIIMLTNLVERGTVKCSNYYPCEDEEPILLSDNPFLKVTCLSTERHSYYRVNNFQLEEITSGKKREVLHFHYGSWSDFSVPQSPEAFLRFLHEVRLSGSLDPTVGPPVIHCSAGIGRSGTFCLVDSSLVLIKKRGGANGLHIQELLLEMRRCRMGLIQTPEQLRFSYIAIIEGAETILERGSLGDIYIEDDAPEGPPPLPPRSRPNSSVETTPTEETKPLPQEDDKTDSKPSEQQELRKRKRDTQKEELAKKVGNMKKKMKKSEEWKETRHSKSWKKHSK